MPRNGSGAFTRPVASYVPNTAISSTSVNAEMDGIATGLSNSIAKDGQTTITANLPMATFKHTGGGNASARTDYAAAGQVQDGSFLWGGTAGGTADALTISLTPAITAYATGQTFCFKAGASSNTTSATIAINGLAAQAIEINDSALVGGEIVANKYYKILYDGTAFQLTRVSATTQTPGLVLISSVSASNSAAIDFTGIDSTYDVYEVHVTNAIPATDSRDLLFRTSTDGGSSYDSGGSDYGYAGADDFDNGSASSWGSTGDSSIILASASSNLGSDTNEYGAALVLRLFAPSEASYTRVQWSGMGVNTSGTFYSYNGAGRRLSAADVDAIRFVMSSGNIESGTFSLYGVST